MRSIDRLPTRWRSQAHVYILARMHRGFPMKRIALFTLLLICCISSISYALPPELSNSRTLPPKGSGDTPHPSTILGGGDNFATATVIPGIPYADGGSTCGATNDYNPSCLFSTAPDVVYRFTPVNNMCVDVSLCGSAFDTGLWIYDGTTATDVACQDDSPACGLQSDIHNVALTAGHNYFIVIDGYNVACGQYTLHVTECPPPPVCDPCPAAAVLEGEPACSDGYIDTYNGGCNSTPPVFLSLPCNPDLFVCGTYGTFNANGTRDTDWYQFTLTAPAAITVSVNGQGLTGTSLAIIDNLCPPNVICGSFTQSAQCATNTCNAVLGPGTYRIFTASFFDNTPCNSPYTMHISGMACPTNAQATSWGRLKTIYR
jgi:hypothetical protein